MDKIEAAMASLKVWSSVSMPGIPADTFVEAFKGSPHFGLFLEDWLSQGRGGSGGSVGSGGGGRGWR